MENTETQRLHTSFHSHFPFSDRIIKLNTGDNPVYFNTACPTRYRNRHFFNNSNTNEDIATKFEQEYVRCVRNEKECVCSGPNCCDTERRSASQPGSVASGTHCTCIHCNTWQTLLHKQHQSQKFARQNWSAKHKISRNNMKSRPSRWVNPC